FPFGLLVIRSGFIPGILGYLLIIAGSSYVVGSLNFVLSPPFANVVSTVVSVGYIGELGAVVWLVVAAARVQFAHPLNLNHSRKRYDGGSIRRERRRVPALRDPAPDTGPAQQVVGDHHEPLESGDGRKRRNTNRPVAATAPGVGFASSPLGPVVAW